MSFIGVRKAVAASMEFLHPKPTGEGSWSRIFAFLAPSEGVRVQDCTFAALCLGVQGPDLRHKIDRHPGQVSAAPNDGE